MTSQLSIRKLLLQEIRQNGWMFGLTGLAHFLTGPVVLLLNTSNEGNWSLERTFYRYQAFFTDDYPLWQIFVIIFCICVSIFSYKYLFSRRMTDLYHSVPIHRKQLFMVKYLHGLLIWLLPFVLNILSVFLLCIMKQFYSPYLFPILGTVLKSGILILFCFFIFYHLYLVAVYLSGNALNMFSNTAIIGFSVMGLFMMLHSYASYYFDTFCDRIPILLQDLIFSISPFAAPFSIAVYFGYDTLFSDHMLLIFLSTVLSVVLLFCAYALCLKRPSELAEQGTILKYYLPIARFLVSFIAGIAGSLFFSEISSRDLSLPWGIFGAILFAVVCYGAISSIFYTTIKAFFKHRIQMLCVIITGVATVVIFQLDLLGYDTYLPAKENIAGMAIYSSAFSDNSQGIMVDEETGILTYIDTDQMVSQEELLTDPEACYNLLNTFASYPEGDYSSTHFYAKIKLKNGYTYERSYRLPDTEYELTAPFIENEAYKNSCYQFSTGAFGYPTEMSAYIWHNAFELDKETIIKVMDAYHADFEEHYNLDSLSSHMRLYELSGCYPSENDSSMWFSIDVYDNYTRTLEIMEELYPDYIKPIYSPEELAEIHIDFYPYINLSENSYTLDTLYEYFGYEGSVPAENNTDYIELTINENSLYKGPSEGAATLQENPMFDEASLTIQEAEEIKTLYPYLYYGDYTDIFDRKEYIYLGYVTTQNHRTIDCYVKSASLPKELIEEWYQEFMKKIQ